MVVLSLPVANNTVQAFSGAKVHLLNRLVKTMFEWIFLSLILTLFCKHTYSKNNVKFLQLTISELLQKLLKLYRIKCFFK